MTKLQLLHEYCLIPAHLTHQSFTYAAAIAKSLKPQNTTRTISAAETKIKTSGQWTVPVHDEN